jgi:hypothetical protein
MSVLPDVAGSGMRHQGASSVLAANGIADKP